MIYTPLTKLALDVCFMAHRDQRDKSGAPYVFHPFHLAEQMDTEAEVCVALLHDVAEDTDLTLEELATMGFPAEVVNALRLLCHSDDVPYMDYVRALRCNPIARKVKLADLRHNSTIERLNEVTQQDLQRREKYLRAMELLQEE